MLYVGMDVHLLSTTICIFDPTADERRRYRTVKVPTTAEAIRGVLEPLNGDCKAVFEIGPHAQAIMAIVKPLAADVLVANPSLIPWLFRDGRKNDKIDARKLVTLLYLNQVPTVHLPRADIAAWRALINHRRTVVKRRTRVKNQIRSILRAYLYRCPHRSCWTRVGRIWLSSLAFDELRQFMVESQTAELDGLDEKLNDIHRQLDRIARLHSDVALLQTIPGVGPRTAEAVVAFTDGVKRFRDGKQFSSNFGVVPTLDVSDGRGREGCISRRGASVVRWLVVEAAHVVIRRNPEMRAFFERVHRGRKDRYKKAIVATARKLLVIAYAMMRDQSKFAPQRVSAAA
ncbi:MAG: IS110 family transposase [Phycisphaerales bacterium]|nr:IS110 family transposase [Phycisphaerales bacterium]MCB9851638.1 IS110 family transposase [Phycisphaerales bacterium]MCB9853525.1 IS110 family transposase [Phycisphaerales bacterium]MCB9854046.1 IS110 family transposase [Phycisphaerales bacterium]MCB9855932.1 IS110 family transposase [Phycisphaerales bacterium]